MLQSLLLVLSLCLDTFVASIAYGADKIKIPFYSSIIINLNGGDILELLKCISKMENLDLAFVDIMTNTMYEAMSSEISDNIIL